MNWGRHKNKSPPNYCNGRMPDIRTYPGTLKEYDIEKKRAIALQSSDGQGDMDMQIGDRYVYTQVNIFVDARGKRIPDSEELYQDILRKRKGGGYR